MLNEKLYIYIVIYIYLVVFEKAIDTVPGKVLELAMRRKRIPGA